MKIICLPYEYKKVHMLCVKCFLSSLIDDDMNKMTSDVNSLDFSLEQNISRLFMTETMSLFQRKMY